MSVQRAIDYPTKEESARRLGLEPQHPTFGPAFDTHDAAIP